jgi:hypothetical protein
MDKSVKQACTACFKDCLAALAELLKLAQEALRRLG